MRQRDRCSVTGQLPVPSPPYPLRSTERMGEVTGKGNRIQFWFLTQVSGLKVKNTSVKERTYQQDKP